MTETLYIQSATTLVGRCERIQQVIYALELKAVEAAAQGDIEEYEVNDGQEKIRTKFNTPDKIATAIFMYERMYQSCLNKLNGRNFVLRDFSGLR